MDGTGLCVKLDREQDVEVLRQAAMILEKENQRLVDENMALQRRLLALEGKSPDEMQTRIAALEEQLASIQVSRRAAPARDGEPSFCHEPRPRSVGRRPSCVRRP